MPKRNVAERVVTVIRIEIGFQFLRKTFTIVVLRYEISAKSVFAQFLCRLLPDRDQLHMG